MIRPGLSIIVPTYNEAANMDTLITRVAQALSTTRVKYEIIIIDDHSTDKTKQRASALSNRYPVHVYSKKGKRGKGFSLIEGYDYASFTHICMLDADLQYPPEIIPQLYKQAQLHGFAVANRKTYNSTLLRKLGSRMNAFIFGRLLLNLKTDVQSGLKVFHREVFAHVDRSLVSGWGLDIPLVHTAYEMGHSVGHVDIDFTPREKGVSKINFLETAIHIAKSAIKTRLLRKPILLKPDTTSSMIGSGIAHKRKRFLTHTTLAQKHSAFITFVPWQQALITLLGVALVYGLSRNALSTAITAVAILSGIYFIDVLFNLYVILKSLHFPPEISVPKDEVAALKEKGLPLYTILCPLYKEARVLPHFVKAMETLDWPKDKLEIMLLLEQDDEATIAAAKALKLPDYFRIVIVPDSQPKTKPKASNYGLGMARGEYIVVFDAEDEPDPQQLKKAYIAFSQAPASVVCLQAKLNYYNPHHNVLTRLFTAEYSLWFDVILPGLQSLNTSIPLGGTSNHFRTADLRRLEGWDPFNVTEDCDLGARLFKAGCKTAIIDSTTLEEANSDVKNWFRQRSRWIKGYIQTYFVHMRHPVQFAREHGVHAFIFQLVVGGKIAFMLINPILWVITISYFALNSIVGPTIEALYPASIFYMAAFSLVFGNFICLYNYMIGCVKRGHTDLVKYVFIIPVYWLMISWAACIATYQLIFKPHYWEKTIHGLHLEMLERKEIRQAARLESAKARAHRFAHIADLAQSKIFVGGGVLILASVISNLSNFLTNAYLGRRASLEHFSEIGLIGSLLYLANVPIGALGRAVTHRSAYLLGKYNAPIKLFWSSMRKRGFRASLIIAAIWIGLIPFLMLFFNTHDPIPFLLFTPVWTIGILTSIDSGFITGNLSFKILGLLGIVETISRLILTIALVELGLGRFIYAAIPLSMSITLTVGWLQARKTKNFNIPEEEQIQALQFPRKFFATSILLSLTSITYLSLDLLLVKHYFSSDIAGQYVFLTLAGKMVYFLGSLVSQFILPLTSRDVGAGASTKKLIVNILGLVVFINLLAYIFFGLFGFVTVPMLWGQNAASITHHLPMYAAAMVFYSLSSVLISYNQARGRHGFVVLGFILGSLQTTGIILFHNSLDEVVRIITYSSIVTLLALIVFDRLYWYFVVIGNNVKDFFGLFAALPPVAPLASGKKRILIFNWRDLRHKWAGGAEVYIHELGKRWVKMGHEVTVFCGNDTTSKRHEAVDGVKIIRRGGFYFVYIWAYLYYKFRFQGRYDIIIDSENGLPFFTPLYAKEKSYLLIHHVHQEVFRKSLLPPFSWIAQFLERRIMPMVYRNTEVITVSPSSKADILRHKLTTKEPYLVYNGVDLKRFTPGAKSRVPLVLYVGRLTSAKSIHVFLSMTQKIHEKLPNVRFVIAGEGPERMSLTKLAKKMGLEDIVEFMGRVSEETKRTLMQRAWVFVNPSLIEGWGITTIEANACGTPVVASNVAGLRDAVHNPHSGFLVPYGNVDEFTLTVMGLLQDKKTRNRMSKDAREWAQKFDWEQSAQTAITIL
jgi:cellulose synthase/poly-beta-1,6-N-acetylglucosamine synthase-like glycosyltransferase/glycosyltransferase involved in cell wall biosynthesis/O-antigen/teichoic acid export membrane protein